MNKYYILYNGKVWLSDNKMPKHIDFYLGKDQTFTKPYDDAYSNWKSSLKICDIDEAELENVKNKVYTFDNCKADNPIDVTDLIFDYGCDHDGVWRPNLKFSPKKSDSLEVKEKCDCGYMADEKGICTECNLPKPFGNTEQVDGYEIEHKLFLESGKEYLLENFDILSCDVETYQIALIAIRKAFRQNQSINKEQIIKWITQRIKDEQRKHSSHDENWQEIAARKIYASYDIKLKTD